MFKGKLIELPQLEHPLLIYEQETTLLLMIICLFSLPTNHIRNEETGSIIQMCQKKKGESKELHHLCLAECNNKCQEIEYFQIPPGIRVFS